MNLIKLKFTDKEKENVYGVQDLDNSVKRWYPEMRDADATEKNARKHIATAADSFSTIGFIYPIFLIALVLIPPVDAADISMYAITCK